MSTVSWKKSSRNSRHLSHLILDCWMRNTGRRPYDKLHLTAKMFEEKLFHEFNENDLRVIIEYLNDGKVKALNMFHTSLMLDKITELATASVNLVELSLINVNLPSEFLRILSENVSKSATKVLRLSFNQFDQHHARYLRHYLIHSTSLQFLDIGYCGITPILLASIADGVHKAKELKGIDLSRIINDHSYDVIDELKITMIAEILLRDVRLTEINLRYCSLDAQCMNSISCVLNVNSTLQHLDIACNKIGADGAEIILKTVVESNINLIGLNLSRNQLQEAGGYAVARYLTQSRIRYLDVSANNISADGMFLLVASIKKPFPLKVLNLSGNLFDARVAALLQRSIKAKCLRSDSIDVRVEGNDNDLKILPQENDSKFFQRIFVTQD